MVLDELANFTRLSLDIVVACTNSSEVNADANANDDAYLNQTDRKSVV